MKNTAFILFMSLVLYATSAEAQQKQKKTTKTSKADSKNKSSVKSKTNVEELPPPPPPKEIQDLKIDIISEEDAKKIEEKDSEIKIDFDTTAAPADALTIAIKKMLKITGSLNLGVQFGKMLNEMQNTDQNGLPKQFYERFFQEIQFGESAKTYENLIVKIYRRYFTLDDVNKLIQFYESPAGKKYAELLPDILEASKLEGVKFGQWLGTKVYYDLMKEGKLK